MKIKHEQFIVILAFFLIITLIILTIQTHRKSFSQRELPDFQKDKTSVTRKEAVTQAPSILTDLVSTVQTDTVVSSLTSKTSTVATKQTNTMSILANETIIKTEITSDDISDFAKHVVQQLKDTSISLEKREKIITELARKGEKESINALKFAVSANIYLSLKAMDAIGEVKNDLFKEELAQFSRAYFTHEDSRMVCSALRTYAKLRGKDAIPEIIETIRINKERADGHSDMIAYSGVKLLGELYAVDSIPFLRDELNNATKNNWNLEYGSHIMRALMLMGTPAASKVAGEYAQILSSRIPSDPLAREYFKHKIEEAQSIANLH